MGGVDRMRGRRHDGRVACFLLFDRRMSYMWLDHRSFVPFVKFLVANAGQTSGGKATFFWSALNPRCLLSLPLREVDLSTGVLMHVMSRANILLAAKLVEITMVGNVERK